MKLRINGVLSIMLLLFVYALPTDAQNKGIKAVAEETINSAVRPSASSREIELTSSPSSTVSEVTTQDCSGTFDPKSCAILIQLRNSLSGVEGNTAATVVAVNNVASALNNLKASIDNLKTSSDNTNTLMRQQVQQANQLLYDAIAKRFDGLPRELLTNELVKQHLDQLKKDILQEVDKRLAKPAGP